MNFPQYRKYKNIETYFKIISEKQFEEIVVLGEKYMVHQIKAVQFPEMLRIQDMLQNKDDLWEVLNEVDYLKKVRSILQNYQKVN